jgi:hypothetical protein
MNVPAAERILYGEGRARQSMAPHPRLPALTDLHYLDNIETLLAAEGGAFVSIVRVGLAETRHFAEGYEAIFGKTKPKKPAKRGSGPKTAPAKKKKPAKKK